ncbi:hypothetical protein JL49_19615 [Pseudoalteromonas luteoviolacea]|nr:hypothetical protein JL49_19615 [Pseudoalteromonas luteoviolacea]
MDALCRRLEKTLFDKHGPIIGGTELYIALGFSSASAFRQAVRRKTIPNIVFSLESRKGKFALTFDVAEWLAKQKYKTTE